MLLEVKTRWNNVFEKQLKSDMFNQYKETGMKYQFTKDMREISGFGGGYEAACRKMLSVALIWLDEHPSADPQFSGYKNVYGLVKEDNADAKALSKAVIDAVPGCSGAQHQAVLSSAMWIKANGWYKYVQDMTHPEGEVGILKEKIEELQKDLINARQQRDSFEAASMKRGRIIARDVLKWQQYPASDFNDVQKVYAPSKAKMEELILGDRLHKFIDEAIEKMAA